MPRPQDSNWSAPRPRTPAPQIDPVPLWPTPDKRDLLFYVEKNGDLPQNKTWAYGDSYSDTIKYPDHKLVFVSPQSPDSWSKWYYASDRIEQDEYNWSFTDADIGGTKFQAVSREYILPRSEWHKDTPAMGSAMGDVPKDKFAGVFVLAERQQIKIEDEVLTSLYVFEKRTYVKKVTLIDNEYNPELEQNLSTTQTLRYRGEVVSGTPIETLVADEDNTYWGLTGTTSRSAQQLSDNWFLVVEKKLSVRRSASDTYSDDWPLKQVKVKGTAAEVPARYADQVTSVETTTKVDLPAANVDNIPDPADPSGEVAQNIHEKVSDLHYQVRTLSKNFNLDPSLEDIEVDVKPFVKITTRARGGLSSELPATGSGSSQLIWKGGDQKLYENRDVDSEAREGMKSTEDKDQQWGSYTEQTDYSVSPVTEPGGSSQLIYDDGETKVYEVSRITGVRVDGTTKDKDPQQWGFATWNGIYSDQEDVGADRTRQVWRKGAYRVYLNETVTTEVSGSTTDKDPQNWGTLTWDGSYSEAQDLSADRSRQVWRIGSKYVFLNETARVEVSGTTKDIDPQQWGTLTWNGTYAEAPGEDRSRQVWRMGNRVVFLNETVVVEVSGSTRDKDPQQWGSLTWVGSYSTDPDGNADRFRQVWRLGANTVFLNETAAVEISGSTKDIDPQQWGTLTWDGTYAEAPGEDRSRQVWRMGNRVVFLNEIVTVSVSGTTKDKDPQQWGSLTWDGSYALSPAAEADRFRQVWSLKDKVVYLNENAVVAVEGTTRDSDAQQWGTLVWSGRYETTPTLAVGDRSRQVWKIGEDKVVFLNETPSTEILADSFVSAREENPILIETQTTSYGIAPIDGTNTRSRIVFSLGTLRVYENTIITRSPKEPRIYPSVIQLDLPPILRTINASVFTRRDGNDEYYFQPVLTHGFQGAVPCEVTERWSENPGSSEQPVIFKPEPVQFASPLGGFSVPRSLHGQQIFQVSIGTDHPIYEQQVHVITIPETSPPTWEGQTFLVAVDSDTYREGYIVREFRVTL